MALLPASGAGSKGVAAPGSRGAGAGAGAGDGAGDGGALSKVDIELGVHINGATTVQVAAYLSTYEIFKALVDAGADTSLTNENGSTVLVSWNIDRSTQIHKSLRL